MITNRSIPDTGLDYLPIYANIERSAIMKVAPQPEMFRSTKVIGWILPKADVTKIIFSNTEGKCYAAYIPAYVA